MSYTSNYNRVNWQNDPNKATPLGASNLNKMDSKIADLDKAMEKVDPDYIDALKEADPFIGFTVDSDTGKITMTRYSGAKVEYDTDLEKIPLQYRVDKEHEKIILTQSDGTEVELDLSQFISVSEFKDTDQIVFVEDKEKNEIRAYLSDTFTEKLDEAIESATLSKSYAVGGTNTREGEDTDNAKYYKEQAKAIVGFDGTAKTVPFDNTSNGFVSGNVQNAIEEVNDKKINTPTKQGTKGQVLTLGDNNIVVWEDGGKGQGALTYRKAEYDALTIKPEAGTHVVITDDGIGIGGSSSGSKVVANPTTQATVDLNKLSVDGVTYAIPQSGGTNVVANPSEDSTTDLTKLKVDNTVYGIPTQTVDSALSTTSENPVQNKVVANAINQKGTVGATYLDNIKQGYALTVPIALGNYAKVRIKPYRERTLSSGDVIKVYDPYFEIPMNDFKDSANYWTIGTYGNEYCYFNVTNITETQLKITCQATSSYVGVGHADIELLY